jgi:outer membrane protein assembly factor BamD (BamD/ComL family)
MKIDFLFEKAIENLRKKDFNVAIAEQLLEAVERDYHLSDPIH